MKETTDGRTEESKQESSTRKNGKKTKEEREKRRRRPLGQQQGHAAMMIRSRMICYSNYRSGSSPFPFFITQVRRRVKKKEPKQKKKNVPLDLISLSLSPSRQRVIIFDPPAHSLSLWQQRIGLWMTRVRRGFTSVLLGLDDEGEKGLHFVSVGNISKQLS